MPQTLDVVKTRACGHIRQHLDQDRAKFLATALVSSCLDYCNSLLYGIADTDLVKLQCIQNRLAHVVAKSPPFSRSVPLLCSLHCLPVMFRILFKISLLTYKTLREKQPVYIHSMLDASLPSHSLGSNKENRLHTSLHCSYYLHYFLATPTLRDCFHDATARALKHVDAALDIRQVNPSKHVIQYS